MKFPRVTSAVLFLATMLSVRATTITLTGNLSTFSYQSSDPAQYAGLAPVAAGNPYSLKLVFDDTLLAVPFSGGATTTASVLSLFELSVNGSVLASMTNIKAQFLNDVGGRDSIYIQHNGTLSVTGMNPFTYPGYVSMQIHDSSQSAFQYGEPVNFAKFFDNAADGFAMAAGINLSNPYSGGFSELQITALGDPTPVNPSAPGVPDAAATLPLFAIGLAGLAALRRRRA